MKGIQRILIKLISVATTAAFLSVSVFSSSVYAAPVITVKTTQGSTDNGAASGNTVSNIRLINLDQPGTSDALDTTATIMTDQGLFWEIPVVWIDENGTIVKNYVPRKRLMPIFAFYVPAGITIAQNSAIGGFTIILPDFLDGQFDTSKLLLVTDPSNNITYITSTGIASTLSAMSNPARLYQNIISSGNGLGLVNNRVYGYVSGDDSDDDYSPTETKPQEQDPVLIYCSKSAIEHLGYDNMAMLYKLISDVILPQVVSQLTTAIPAFTTSNGGKAIGEKIGLLVYTSEYPDSQASSQTSIAYVSGIPVGTDSYYYMMGVNAKTLFTLDPETGTYKYNEKERVNLENTVIHEMLHAFMDDYTRAGVVRMPDQSNDYPGWFCEGIASAVENVYTFRFDQYSKIYGYSRGTGSGTLQANENDVLTFYKNYSEIYPAGSGIIHVPDIGTSEDPGNRISAYTMGYLATVYLSHLANAKTNGTNPLNNNSFTSDKFRDGLNTIFLRLHEGETLDTVIIDISDGKYTSTDDFTAKFVKGEKGNGTNNDEAKEASLEFCVSYLNYLGTVTTQLRQTDPNATANGSILLPLDTTAKSPIQEQAPEGAKENQKYFNIYHDPTVEESDQPYVKSTVDPALALQSGGKTQNITDGNETGGASNNPKVGNEPYIVTSEEEPTFVEEFTANETAEPADPEEESAEFVTATEPVTQATSLEPTVEPEVEPAVPTEESVAPVEPASAAETESAVEEPVPVSDTEVTSAEATEVDSSDAVENFDNTTEG